MTIYLKFDTPEQAAAALVAAGFTVSESGDSAQRGDAWAVLFGIPHVDGWHVNIRDCGDIPELSAFEIPAPATPYNVRFR